MIIRLFTSLLLSAGTIAGLHTEAFAQETSTSTISSVPLALQGPKVNQGDWEIGGAASFFRSEMTDLEVVSLTPKLEYFFLNRFSAGAKLNYLDTSLTSPAVMIGPSLTYHFALIDDLTFYVDQAVLYTNPAGSGDNYFTGQTGVGLDWFLVPSVALGPSLRSTYHFSGNEQDAGEGFAIAVNLSVFL